MFSDSPAMKDSGTYQECDPFLAAKRNLFPPLRNKILAQASEALAQNRVDTAESLVSAFLEKKPRDAAALNLMADIARRSQRFEEAEQLLSRCVKEAPDCDGYRFNYAVVLRRPDKFGLALAQLDELLKKNPRNPLFREQKALVLRLMGRHAESLEYRRALSEEYPSSPEAWLNYADSLRGMGDDDRCVAAYHKALELAPSSSKPYWRLADLKTYRFSALEIQTIEKELTNRPLDADVRANLHYALGKAYGDQKVYAKSFENYAKSNALRRLDTDFDPERLTAHRLNCESVFTEAFFRARSGWGCASSAPIFIVGIPRSGSTLIEQILSSHTAIEGLGELGDLDLIVGHRLSRTEGRPPHTFWIGGWFEFRSGLLRSFPRMLQSMDADDCRSMGEEYLTMTLGRRVLGRPFFTDKGLRNFGYVGLIRLLLPNAKIVDVRRHPLDCAWSCFKSHFPTGQPFANRLTDIGSHYANYVRLMAHFDRVQPGSIHRVIYEDLIADPETEMRRLFEYLGLPFEEACLRFHENRRAVATLSSEQVRKPLYSGVAQWRPYEPWLDTLKTALGPVLDMYPRAPD